MCNSHRLLYLGMLVMAVVSNKMLDDCLSVKHKYTMNVVLLEDNTYEWSRPFVQAAVEQAIEEDRLENENHGMDWCFLAAWTPQILILLSDIALKLPICGTKVKLR